jgi:2-methylisocitrate lyase-like PEP mutase family enzyme
MTNQVERATTFAQLHVAGDPLILFNIWDAGSAQAVAGIGAKAIATGSWSVAAANGYTDGEEVPLDFVLSNLRRIVASVNLPVTLDMESGYARQPAEITENVARVIEAGAIGINFEDQIVGGEGLYEIEEQTTRVAAVRRAAEAASVPFFINARTDVFLKAPPETHSAAHLQDAIVRAQAYAQAGASGFFAPGLRNPEFIEKLCRQSPLPVNIMYVPDAPPTQELARLGVARLSYGPFPYRWMIEGLKTAGREALGLGQ